MFHDQHYTLDQANAARGWVTTRVERMRAALARLDDRSARAALLEIDGTVGGWYPGRAVASAAVSLSLAAAELEAADIVVRDAVRGLVDFPAIVEGEEVYLCWMLDEPEVGHWHEPDAGFAGRRPL